MSQSREHDYFDGVEVTRNPWHTRYNRRYESSDKARSQINRAAAPIEIEGVEFGFFFKESGVLPSVQPQDVKAPTIHEENDVNLANEIAVVQSIENFETSVLSMKFIQDDLRSQSRQVSVIEDPGQILNEEKVDIQEKLENKIYLISKCIELVLSPQYEGYKKDFLEILSDLNRTPVVTGHSFDGFSSHEKNYLTEVMRFYDRAEPDPGHKRFNVDLVYLTSGGGKSTLLRNYNFIKPTVDIDNFIQLHNKKFHLAVKFQKQLKISGKFMNLWFKHTLHHYRDSLNGKILFVNHPNQVPYYFRKRELVLIPNNINWDVRFFKENFFSLLGIKGKTKALSNYDGYGPIIEMYFKHKINYVKIYKRN